MNVKYDFNLNGRIDEKDIFKSIYFLYHHLLPDEYPITENELIILDENRDGQIDSDEIFSVLQKITQHLAGYIIQDETF